MDKPDPKYEIGTRLQTPSGGEPSPVVQRKFLTWTTENGTGGAWSYLLRDRFGWYFEASVATPEERREAETPEG